MQETAAVRPTSPQHEEGFLDVHLDDETRSKHSGRSQHSKKSAPSSGVRDNSSLLTIRSGGFVEEPISDVFRTLSLQSDMEASPRPPSPFTDHENERNWEKKWKHVEF